MITFQINVVSLQRNSALQGHQHCWRKKTLEVYWVSETAKIHCSQKQTASVRVHRHGLLSLLGARRLAVPRYHGDEETVLLSMNNIITKNETIMLEKTKGAILAEVAKSTVCVDPAPLPGESTKNVLKALKEDVKEIVRKK